MDSCIFWFLKNPIHGTGILTSESAKEVLGSLSYMQAHNEWLQCLWQGGIILFVIVTVMFLAVAKRINKIVDSKLKVVANLFLVSIFVEMAFEVWLGSQLTWIMLLMIYKMKCMAHCLKLKWYTFYPMLLINIIGSVIMTVLFSFVAKAIAPSTWVGLIVTACILSIFGLGIYFIFVFSNKERKYIINMIKRKANIKQ